ncbi:hypothetical protein U1E44_09165 [Arenibacter sp. GZD96]|uniref:hypothetical protein n=1 Tax=Aurantibrevibacter litoralis TaxID=3106030 RepID=UPI002AFE436D|nr:hypothetical protein [Arenibacter sp. GZD-96]MEA1786258.1 hypothetical protein [Arenibacter sp. GZD-96]
MNRIPICLPLTSFIAILCSVSMVWTQEAPRIFTIADFDLAGAVKSCLVRTNYGKETYDFNEKGVLTKAVTRFNDADYDITYYKYAHGELSEKRVENYRDNIFDRATSYANIYALDTLSGKKVSEQIISYSKEFLGQNEYHFDDQGNLVLIRHADNEGIDEIRLEYTTYKGESTVTYLRDEVVQKTIRTSQKKGKANSLHEVRLTKEFINGEPSKALEQVYNEEGHLISEIKFKAADKTKKFQPEEEVSYTYDALGHVIEMRTKKQDKVVVKKYIYQFDDGDAGNWIKQIVTPDNTYISRTISYYPNPEKAE